MNQSNDQAQKVTKVLVGFSIFIIVIASYFLVTGNNTKPKYGETSAHSANWDNSNKKFELIDMNGKKFSNVFLRGKYSLLYFGFSFCPDICPTELRKMSDVANMLEKDSKDFNLIFITIDPRRDSTSILKKYVSNFHPKLIGLTGTEDEIKHTANLFHVYYEAASKEEKNYMVNHTAYIYLLDQHGRVVKFFDTTASALDIYNSIKTFL
jgi:cytochrome oxidase Cu insertion factor (SCO1/SenC/PrrC family)